MNRNGVVMVGSTVALALIGAIILYFGLKHREIGGIFVGVLDLVVAALVVPIFNAVDKQEKEVANG